MATRRMLAASISVSEQVATLRDDFTRMLFTWMIAHADDWGVLHGSPARVRAVVVPMLDCTTAQVDAALADMEANDLIWRYAARDGTRLIQFRTWEEHQQGLHKRTDPKLARYCDIAGEQPPATTGASARGPEKDVRAAYRTVDFDTPSRKFPEHPGSSIPRARAELNGTEQNRTEEKEKARDRARGSLSLSSNSDEPETRAEPEAATPDPDEERRSDHALFDAWVEATGRAPKTASERRSWVKGLRDLRENAELTPSGVFTLVAQYRAKLGSEKNPTPGQVAGMYSQLGASIRVLHVARAANGVPERPLGEVNPYSDADMAARRAALSELGIPVPALPAPTGTTS